jgi:hypothetical protein
MAHHPDPKKLKTEPGIGSISICIFDLLVDQLCMRSRLRYYSANTASSHTRVRENDRKKNITKNIF